MTSRESNYRRCPCCSILIEYCTFEYINKSMYLLKQIVRYLMKRALRPTKYCCKSIGLSLDWSCVTLLKHTTEHTCNNKKNWVVWVNDHTFYQACLTCNYDCQSHPLPWLWIAKVGLSMLVKRGLWDNLSSDTCCY